MTSNREDNPNRSDFLNPGLNPVFTLNHLGADLVTTLTVAFDDQGHNFKPGDRRLRGFLISHSSPPAETFNRGE